MLFVFSIGVTDMSSAKAASGQTILEAIDITNSFGTQIAINENTYYKFTVEKAGDLRINYSLNKKHTYSYFYIYNDVYSNNALGYNYISSSIVDTPHT